MNAWPHGQYHWVHSIFFAPGDFRASTVSITSCRDMAFFEPDSSFFYLQLPIKGSWVPLDDANKLAAFASPSTNSCEPMKSDDGLYHHSLTIRHMKWDSGNLWDWDEVVQCDFETKKMTLRLLWLWSSKLQSFTKRKKAPEAKSRCH